MTLELKQLEPVEMRIALLFATKRTKMVNQGKIWTCEVNSISNVTAKSDSKAGSGFGFITALVASTVASNELSIK